MILWKKDRLRVPNRLALLGLTSWMLALANVSFSESLSPTPEAVKHRLQSEEKEMESIPDGVIVGGEIKLQDRYRAYLAHAAEISRDLLHVRDMLGSQDRRLNLQQLGALTQRLSVARDRFREGLVPGEETFESYRLINRAVTSLEEAIVYWRVANRYRPWLRSSLAERAEDEDILQLKLQAAVNAIDALEEVVKMRQTLSRELDEDQ